MSVNTAADAQGRNPPPAALEYLKRMNRDDLVAWRVAPDPLRPSADERGLPDEFPFGWFCIDYSDELAVGEVKAVRYFGKELALWRGEDGEARVIDAYCAHYGAHMGVGGKVAGNLLECPFHAWRYDGEGAVKEIPYARVIPPQARRKDCVPHYPINEKNGMIWLWYHPNRVEPLWDVADVPEASDPDWTAFQKFEWDVYTGLENMADNGVDISHFKFVHGAPSVPEYKFSFEGVSRKVLAEIKFTTPRGEVNGAIDSISRGPGQGWVRFSGISETMLVSGVTPIDRDHLKVRFAFTQLRTQAEGPGANLAKAILKDLCNQLDQDKVILDRHRVMSPPLICDGDGPFGRNRIFYSQFYVSTNPDNKLAA